MNTPSDCTNCGKPISGTNSCECAQEKGSNSSSSSTPTPGTCGISNTANTPLSALEKKEKITLRAQETCGDSDIDEYQKKVDRQVKTGEFLREFHAGAGGLQNDDDEDDEEQLEYEEEEQDHLTVVMDKSHMPSLMAARGSNEPNQRISTTLPQKTPDSLLQSSSETSFEKKSFVDRSLNTIEGRVSVGIFLAAVCILGYNLHLAQTSNPSIQIIRRIPKSALILPTRPMPSKVEQQAPEAAIPSWQDDEFTSQPVTPEQEIPLNAKQIQYRLRTVAHTAAPTGDLTDQRHITHFLTLNASELIRLRMRGCAEFSFEGGQVSDEELSQLKNAGKVKLLNLQDAYGFSKDGIESLENVNIEQLYFDGPHVSDKWIPLITKIPLERLSMLGNPLSVQSIESLAKSKTLKFVTFEGNDPIAISNLFMRGGWMRLPEGRGTIYSFYRTDLPNNAQ